MSSQISTQQAVGTWKEAHRFVLDVYKLTNRLPREEHYGLIPKIRTSAVKVASNIVEGYARKSDRFYLRHLTDSQVALEETKYSLLVARDLGYISEGTYDKVMADAEALSERLTSLQTQLGVAPDEVGEPEAASTAPLPNVSGQGGWFAVEHGVSNSLREFWDWFSGKKRKEERQAELEGRVWAEESPTTNYLEEAKD